MAEAKTTGKVNQRSDRSIEIGGTILIVSGLLTISWRVYTAGKVPFWSAWPGILGFAVACVGLIMMIIGVGGWPGRVDSNGDGNSSDQRQTAATDGSAQRSNDP